MRVVDRIRMATGVSNSLQQPPDDPASVAALHGATLESASPAGQRDNGRPAYASEPEAIARAYYVEARGQQRRYYDDYRRAALAIRANDRSIATQREDLNTVRAVVDLAAARGWQSVTIRGSADFRREAWIEATAHGLQAHGYRPGDPDRQEADRRASERPAPADRPTPPQTRQPVGETPASAPATPTDSHTPSPAAQTVQAAHRNEVEERRRFRAAQADLSPDARTVLAALAEKIDRQMARQTVAVKLELKAYAAEELAKRERRAGSVVLSAEQRRAASAPQTARATPEHFREPFPPVRALTR